MRATKQRRLSKALEKTLLKLAFMQAADDVMAELTKKPSITNGWVRVTRVEAYALFKVKLVWLNVNKPYYAKRVVNYFVKILPKGFAYLKKHGINAGDL